MPRDINGPLPGGGHVTKALVIEHFLGGEAQQDWLLHGDIR
jgi:hypothetical protein